MTPLEIQFALKKRGITQKSIADEMGVSEFHVSAIIRKIRTSDRIMKEIAKKTGHDHRVVFPEHYLTPK